MSLIEQLRPFLAATLSEIFHLPSSRIQVIVSSSVQDQLETVCSCPIDKERAHATKVQTIDRHGTTPIVTLESRWSRQNWISHFSRPAIDGGILSQMPDHHINRNVEWPRQYNELPLCEVECMLCVCPITHFSSGVFFVCFCLCPWLCDQPNDAKLKWR